MTGSTRYVLRGVAPLGGEPTDLLLADGVIAAIKPPASSTSVVPSPSGLTSRSR